MRLLKLFQLRKGSNEANNGFKAGLIAGLLNSAYILVTMLMFKEQFMEVTEKAAGKVPGSAEQVYLMTIIIMPILMPLIFALLGMFFGMIIKKLNITNSIIIFVLSGGIGYLYGQWLESPTEQYNVIFGVISWLVFAAVFTGMNSSAKNKTEEM